MRELLVRPLMSEVDCTGVALTAAVVVYSMGLARVSVRRDAGRETEGGPTNA